MALRSESPEEYENRVISCMKIQIWKTSSEVLNCNDFKLCHCEVPPVLRTLFIKIVVPVIQLQLKPREHICPVMCEDHYVVDFAENLAHLIYVAIESFILV